MKLSISLPWAPSTNAVWTPRYTKRGKKWCLTQTLNPIVKSYRAKVQANAYNNNWYNKRLKGRLFAHIKLIPPTKAKFDIDNRFKATFDALQKTGLLEDDSQIDKAYVEKHPSEKGGKIDIVFTDLDAHPKDTCLLCGSKTNVGS